MPAKQKQRADRRRKVDDRYFFLIEEAAAYLYSLHKKFVNF